MYPHLTFDHRVTIALLFVKVYQNGGLHAGEISSPGCGSSNFVGCLIFLRCHTVAVNYF